ncbi:hypothetical protein LBMAG56_02240 [Verrucomicrobiota bacterium]|nr:hypothetical protein LBMAG56_02240 [Verrucomicrobiota bacterium]
MPAKPKPKPQRKPAAQAPAAANNVPVVETLFHDLREVIRAAYEHGLLDRLDRQLTTEFGDRFDASNLRYMRLFYNAFPNWNALRSELSATHYRTLPRVEEAVIREWYLIEAFAQN